MAHTQVICEDIKELFKSLDRADSVELDHMQWDMNFEFLTKSDAVVADEVPMSVLPPAVSPVGGSVSSVSDSLPPSPALTELVVTTSDSNDSAGPVMEDLMWMSNIVNLTPESTQMLQSGNTVMCLKDDNSRLIIQPKVEALSPSFESPPPSPFDDEGFPPDSQDNYGVGISDRELVLLSVRELNRRVQGHPRDIITKLKQKRRTLKNRGYAQNCRTRRIRHKDLLERENNDLVKEVTRLKQQLARSIIERDSYKRECERLVKLGNMGQTPDSDDVFNAL